MAQETTPANDAGTFRVETVEGLGRCAFLRRPVFAGEVLLQEEPLLFAPAGLADEAIVQQALELGADGEEDGSDSWPVPLWSGTALDARSVRGWLGLLAAYAASPAETRAAVLALDDCVEPRPLAELLRGLARLASRSCDVKGPEARCVLRVAFVNAFPFGAGAALFAQASLCAHSCKPNAFYSSAGDVGRIVALEALPAGARVSVSYVPRHYTLLPVLLRRRFLRMARGFDCHCSLCESEPAELVPAAAPSTVGQAAPPLGLHVCCCTVPLPGHLLPMLRLARALACRNAIGRVTYLTDALGAARVRAWLEDEPDASGKIVLLGFEDGYDEAMDKQLKQSFSSGAHTAPDVNMLIEANVDTLIWQLMREQCVSYFVVDWYSYGFTKSLSALEAPYCTSAPTSAETLCACLSLTGGAAEPTKALLSDRPVLLHSLSELSGCNVPKNFLPVGLMAACGKGVLEEALLEFLEQPGPPVVYVCLGTLAHLAATELEMLAKALHAPGEWRVLWSLEESLQAQLPCNLGSNFHVAAWVPQAQILKHPRCAAALLHAGWGSVCEALVAGKPICALPLYGDHAINAEALCRLGVCKLVAQPAPFTLRGLPSQQLQADLRAVLVEPCFAAAARHWQRIALTLPPPADRAAELVEGFAAAAVDQPAAVVEAAPGGGAAELGFAAMAVDFAEDPRPLTFEDGDSDEEEEEEELPRGARLEMLLLQSKVLLGVSSAVTEWLLRLRFYRDFARLCGHGDAVIRQLVAGDASEFLQTAVEVHEALLRRGVLLGLASPLLEGEPQRPHGLASQLLAIWPVLASRLDRQPAAQEEALVVAARRAAPAAWWEALTDGAASHSADEGMIR